MRQLRASSKRNISAMHIVQNTSSSDIVVEDQQVRISYGQDSEQQRQFGPDKGDSNSLKVDGELLKIGSEQLSNEEDEDGESESSFVEDAISSRFMRGIQEKFEEVKTKLEE